MIEIVIVLLIGVVLQAAAISLINNRLGAEVRARQALHTQVKELLQQIADQVDASTALIETSNTQMNNSFTTLDTKIHALAATQGLVSVNGLWQYETVISAESTQKAKPAVKKTPAKKGAK